VRASLASRFFDQFFCAAATGIRSNRQGNQPVWCIADRSDHGVDDINDPAIPYIGLPVRPKRVGFLQDVLRSNSPDHSHGVHKLQTTRLIATKGMRYATRHLRAGDVFEAGYRDAQLLVKIGRAKIAEADEEVTETVVATPAKNEVVEEESASDQAAPVEGEDLLEALRAKAAALGIHVDGRWGEARLLEEIDAVEAR